MADDVLITQGAGTSIGADEISSVKYQRIKLIHGADGVNAGDVSTANPLPVTPIVNAGRVQGKVDNADTTTARAVVAAIASNYVYITSLIISVAVAGNYWLEDADATQITPKFYFPANGGLTWTAEGTTPYKTNTVNKAINVKGSIAGAVGVMLTGYQSTT
jgi:hypothetical protein